MSFDKINLDRISIPKLLPGVSIIIPVYNRAKYIREAIDSVLQQDYLGVIEIIISDDGSTDNSVEIAESYKDERVVILNKPKDCATQGAAGARNRAIQIATQQYICFLDSDDFQLPHFLTHMTEAITQNLNLHFVFCRTLEQKEKPDKISTTMWTRKKILPLDVKYLGMTRSNVINTNCFLFCRSVFDEIGVFNEDYTNTEDTDLWIRIGEHFKGKFIDVEGVVRRSHDGMQLTKNSSSSIKSCTVTMANQALIRNKHKRSEPFRMYKLENIILTNSCKKKSSLFFARLKLILKYPIQFTKHIYLLFS